jgi:predicted RNase H-like nuclease (RuvC/YqgF family)
VGFSSGYHIRSGRSIRSFLDGQETAKDRAERRNDMSDRFDEYTEELMRANSEIELARMKEVALKKQEESLAEVVRAEAGLDSLTNELYRQLRELEEKINVIKEPWDEKIRTFKRSAGEQKDKLWKLDRAIDFRKAQNMLVPGITTQMLAVEFIGFCTGKKIVGDVREVKHNRGKDIHVWAFKGYYGEHLVYIATGKKKMLSAIIVQKSQHVGNYIRNKDFGCKIDPKIKEKSKYHSSYREGLCLNEWLDKALVEWIGMDFKIKVEFWNNID